MNTMQIVTLPGGYIQLNDVMPEENPYEHEHRADMAVINATRVGCKGKSKNEETDKRLLRYLFEHRHTTPFEQVQFKFTVRCPIFVARQWMSNRTWNCNELPQRYSLEDIEFYIPRTWRMQDYVDKQGSRHKAGGVERGYIGSRIDVYNEPDEISTYLEYFCKIGLARYKVFVDAGISREMAQMFLPNNMYTTFVGSVNAYNLMNFLRLHMDENAQYEIRVYAEAMFEMFQDVMPWTAELFKESLNVPT